MLKLLRKELSEQQIEEHERTIAEAVESGDSRRIRAALRPLRKRLGQQEDCAYSLLDLLVRHDIPLDIGLDLVAEIFAAYRDHLQILGQLGEVMERVRDIDQLNLAAPDEPVFQQVVDRLAKFAEEDLSPEDETTVLVGLSSAARMMARQHDDLARSAYKRLTEIHPADSTRHYNYGLFLKTRGYFVEGMAANAIARSLVAQPVESYEWNYGICATGAGEGDKALAVWKGMDQVIEMGRFGLPDGGYPQCKVCLAEKPLAERDSENDSPGREETIWIERLSPCHGVIRSVLYYDLGVDYGDVVLIDGAPIAYHSYGDREIPVFPHLATLRRNNYRFYDFAGTQDEAGRIEDASTDLASDAVIYSHTENFRLICKNCWQDPGIDHEHERREKHVVTGRIAAPPGMDPGDLLQNLDAALEKRSPCRVYSPALCKAAGHTERAQVESRRFEIIRSS